MESTTRIPPVMIMGGTRGAVCESSGNELIGLLTDLEPLLFPWAIARQTPETDEHDQILRDWAELSRSARQRWLDENEY